MTLLTRGIGTRGQGSYLSKAIASFESDKAQQDKAIETFSTELGGIRSGGTYLGDSSRTILNEFANAFEGALDDYSRDASAENKARLNQIKTQALNFQRAAIGARQNSINQYQLTVTNPDDYTKDVRDNALNTFNQYENADDMTARFDMDSMEMFIGSQDAGMQSLGRAGYYNGATPLFYSKKPEIGSIKAEGEYATSHYDQYAPTIMSEGGKDQFIEGFVETARFDSSGYQDTAIMNYLLDEKNISRDDAAFLERIREVRDDSVELNNALQYMGELEYNQLLSIKTGNDRAAQGAQLASLFRGDRDTRTDMTPTQEPELVSDDPAQAETGSAMYIDNMRGVNSVRMLGSALTTESGEGGIAGLDEFGDVLVGYDVDSTGAIVVEVHKEVVDPNDEEQTIMKPSFHVLHGDEDLYMNIRRQLEGKGIFGLLQGEAILRQEVREKEVNDRRISQAYANTQDVETPSQFETTTTAADVRRVTGPSLNQQRRDQRAQEVKDLQDEIPLNIADTSVPKVIVSPTTGDKNVAGINRRFIGRLADAGYSTAEIRNGLDYMKENNIQVEVSPLRSFFQRTLGVGDDLGKAVQEFEKALMASSPGYEAKFMTGPVDTSEEMLGRAESDRLFGRNFTGGLQASEIAVSDRQDDDQKQNFTTTLVDLGRKNGVVFPEVMASQSVIESGWGTSESAPNNVFGIKYSASLLKDLEDKGIKAFRGSEVSTQEEEGGELREIQTNFMGFESLEDAVKAYKYLIESRSAYKEAREAENALDFARALQGTYATDSQYAEKIQSIATDSLGVDLSQIERQF